MAVSSLVTFPNIKPEDMDARGILKQSPLHPINGQDHLTKQQKFARSKLRVSINLPDNEISLLRSRRNLSFSESSAAATAEPPTSPSPSPHSSSLASASIGRIFKGKAPATARGSLENGGSGGDHRGGRQAYRSTRTVVEVLRELDADIVALQDVKAEEEREMKPLSELAVALGMSYEFAERWGPEYGNAVLSRWPIKHWKIQKIFDDIDFRCARDVQIRNEGRLHTGVTRLPIQVHSKVVFGPVIERDIGSPHCKGRRNEMRKQPSP